MPRSGPETAPERFADWLKDLEKVRRRPAYTFPLEFVVERIRARFTMFSEAAVQHMAWHGTREEGGQRAWKFDPLHQSRAPLPMPEAYARAFWERVACPVLYVEGSSGWLRGAEEVVAERLRALRARRVTIPDCGHHPHLERPEELSLILVSFLAEVLPTERLDAAKRQS
jgi:pimeloyl-ACP methyl ester carboxylesterase